MSFHNEKCLICDYPGQKRQNLSSDGTDEYICDRCGHYKIGPVLGSAPRFEEYRKSKQWAQLSFWARENSSERHAAKFTAAILEQIFDEVVLPNPIEQTDRLIQYVGDNTTTGKATSLNVNSLAGIMGTSDLPPVSHVSVGFILDTLEKRHLIERNYTPPEGGIRLTLEGWEKYAEIEKVSPRTTDAFMAMAFGKPNSENAFANCFLPAVSATGFQLKRLIDSPEHGLIDMTMRVKLRRARFVISDLTDNNNGAYWESGFAEGLGKPVIYTCERTSFETTRTHFDTNHLQTVIWDASDFRNAIRDLKSIIRNAFPNEAILED